MKRAMTTVQQKHVVRVNRSMMSILAEQLLAGLAWYG
jgi:hypothetical protein